MDLGIPPAENSNVGSEVKLDTTRTTPSLLSIVIPLYNEERIVNELVSRTVSSCRLTKIPFEIIIVNDGSKDKTLFMLKERCKDTAELRVLDMFRNFGHMPALSAGLAAAGGDIVVVMDGDLQDPPEVIPQFVDAWYQGADVVYGLRTIRHESPLQQTLTRVFYQLLQHFSEIKIPTQVGTFGLMDRRVVEVINAMPERARFFAGLRAWVGGNQAFIAYERPERVSGESRVGFQGLFRLARVALISFSKMPLRYASMLAFTSGLLLMLVGIWAVGEKLLTHHAIPGWATFTTLIGFLGFTQSLVLSALSEYVAVIFDEVKARPVFLVRAEYSQANSASVSAPYNKRAETQLN